MLLALKDISIGAKAWGARNERVVCVVAAGCGGLRCPASAGVNVASAGAVRYQRFSMSQTRSGSCIVWSVSDGGYGRDLADGTSFYVDANPHP